jgi:threonine dehydratase
LTHGRDFKPVHPSTRPPVHPTPRLISIASIAAASGAIDPVFLHTPCFEADSLGAALGCRLVVKVETVNPIRSFKGRGAEWFAHRLDPGAPALVCASAGNFGQGLAWAARRRGLVLDVFASVHANPLKIVRMRELGATVHQVGEDFDAAKDAARAWAARAGRRYVEDGREPAIAEGAGTIAVELLAGGAGFDAVVIPLGNGALLGGMATWIRTHAPATEIIGVCAATAPAMQLSWQRGQVVTTESARTIADGIAVRVPIREAIDSLQGLVDDVLLVDDERTLRAMHLLHRSLGLVVEPAGAVGVAAVAGSPARFSGKRVATVLCGGNVTPEVWETARRTQAT